MMNGYYVNPRAFSEKQKKRKLVRRAGLVLLLLLLSGACLFFLLREKKAPPGQPAFEEAVLLHVTDGDTVYLRLSSGQEAYVRLTGIDAPESVHPDETKNTEAGRRASAYLSSLLAPGQVLYLQTGRRNTDRYGRLLRYVWLSVPEDAYAEKEVREKMVNARILLAGHAAPAPYGEEEVYDRLFARLTP